jgi:serine/threonine protein kinase
MWQKVCAPDASWNPACTQPLKQIDAPLTGSVYYLRTSAVITFWECWARAPWGLFICPSSGKQIRRRVALKVLKTGDAGSTVLARFESESQALALMDHVNIALVFNARTTAAGRPYFAMEYVPGIPITDYCDRFLLGFRERLILFQQVC